MTTFFPSQVVGFIDSAFPSVAQALSTPGGDRFYLGEKYAPTVRAVVNLVDAIPGHLLSMNGEQLVHFVAALSAARHAATRWENGEVQWKLEAPHGQGAPNPMVVVRNALAELRDEGVEAAVHPLAFVHDEELRASLRFDVAAVASALANGQWKAATVLAGSVVEALLLDALQPREAEAREAGKALTAAGTLPRRPHDGLDQWHLHELTLVARRLAIISEDTAAQCDLARGFRNLIHPGRERRLRIQCSRATALSAAAAAEHVVEELSRAAPAPA